MQLPAASPTEPRTIELGCCQQPESKVADRRRPVVGAKKSPQNAAMHHPPSGHSASQQRSAQSDPHRFLVAIPEQDQCPSRSRRRYSDARDHSFETITVLLTNMQEYGPLRQPRHLARQPVERILRSHAPKRISCVGEFPEPSEFVIMVQTNCCCPALGLGTSGSVVKKLAIIVHNPQRQPACR